MEFHPGKVWNGNRAELHDYTNDILSYLQANGVAAFGLLAWENTPLDRRWNYAIEIATRAGSGR